MATLPVRASQFGPQSIFESRLNRVGGFPTFPAETGVFFALSPPPVDTATIAATIATTTTTPMTGPYLRRLLGRRIDRGGVCMSVLSCRRVGKRSGTCDRGGCRAEIRRDDMWVVHDVGRRAAGDDLAEVERDHAIGNGR